MKKVVIASLFAFAMLTGFANDGACANKAAPADCVKKCDAPKACKKDAPECAKKCDAPKPAGCTKKAE